MEIIFLLLPSVVCLIVAGSIFSRSALTMSSRMVGSAIVSCGFYLLFDGLTCFPHTDALITVWSFIGLGFVVPTLQITVMLTGWSLRTVQQHYNRSLMLLHLIPFMTGFVLLIGYGLIGFDAAADYIDHGRLMPANLSHTDRYMYGMFQIMTDDFYKLVILVSVFSSVGYLCRVLYQTDFTFGLLFRFLFCRGPIRPLHIITLLYFGVVFFSMFRLRVDRLYVMEHLHWYCFLFAAQAVLLALMGVLAIFLQRPVVYLFPRHSMPHFDDLPVHVHCSRSMHAYNEFDDDESDTYRTLNLRDDLKVLMREECCYLQPGMSRYSVSRRLCVTRRGLDRLVHLLYHVSYEEYVMVQRVSYYKRYRQRYPNESIRNVAIVCGFPSVKEMNQQILECRTFYGIDA